MKWGILVGYFVYLMAGCYVAADILLLQWAPVTSAVSYTVYSSTNSGMSWNQVATVTGNFVRVETPAHVMTWWVVSGNRFPPTPRQYTSGVFRNAPY